MDAQPRPYTRKFPAYTLANLEAFLSMDIGPALRLTVETEIAARKAGISVTIDDTVKGAPYGGMCVP